MRKLVVPVLAGAGALFAIGAANAADIYASSEYVSRICRSCSLCA